MVSYSHLVPFGVTDRDRFTATRKGEIKLGELLGLATAASSGSLEDTLAQVASQGVRYVLVGVPEDIGVRANLGRPGASAAWGAFLDAFLNTQANELLDPERILLLGSVELSDLMRQAQVLDATSPDYPEKLRSLCSEVDERVVPLIQAIVEASLEPIIIGGGHNNSYPIIRGSVEALRKGRVQHEITCINCDSHLDFRCMEGRHSGNAFTYAHHQGYLSDYRVFGVHEGLLGAEPMTRFKAAHFRYRSYDEVFVRRTTPWEQALKSESDELVSKGRRIGVELDLDVIAGMPSSALSPSGIGLEDALAFVHHFASRCQCVYMHFSEGAPPLGVDGERRVGRALSTLVYTYIRAREGFHRNAPPI